MPRPLQQCAIVVSPEDNVAVSKLELSAGDSVAMPNGQLIEITGPVTPGHRFATAAIPGGEFVRQYAAPIGTSKGIGVGNPVSHDNMSDEVPVVREVPEGLFNAAPEYVSGESRAGFLGFRRSDGRIGTRNWVLVVPTSMCASHEAQQIATLAEYTAFDRERFPNVDGVVALPHNRGCGANDGSNIEVMLRTLTNYADHPNVGAVLFVELGCEKTNADIFRCHMQERGGLSWDKPIEWIGIQQAGGTKATVQQGLAAVSGMFEAANDTERGDCGADELVLGVKCGGSDGFSGLSCNPSLGHCSDLVVRNGGTVMITEVPEFYGAEHIFAMRAKDAAVARQVLDAVDWFVEYAAAFGASLAENPSPGNIAGGLLNITIKSLGAMAKSGTTRVEGVTDYAAPPGGKGLWMMQGPGYDQESTPGLVGAGATAVVFTTGRGTTIGNAITPVVKLASNTPIFERMGADLDLSAGGVIDGTESIEEVGERVFEHVLRVASGDVSAKAEENGHREFQLWAERAVSL